MFRALFIFLVISVFRLMTLLVRLLGFLKKRPAEEKKVLFLAAFSEENAGFQYRVKKWIPWLESGGYKVAVHVVFSKKQETWFRENNWRLYVIPLYHRFQAILASRSYSHVIVRREILIFNDYGNLFLEKLLLSIHPEAILDFDDDIAWAKKEPKEISTFGNLLGEHPAKFTASLQLYSKFIVGSEFLQDYLRKKKPGLNPNQSVVIPTCVDYDEIPAKKYEGDGGVIRFGWIGGVGNIRLLDIIIEDLNLLSREFDIELLMISGKDYTPDVDFPVINKAWSMATQIEDLKTIDIGLMPLYDTPEDRGKCGFKLIQYMGLGIPAVSSAVTVNNEIVSDGLNGWLVPPEGAWLPVLRKACASRARLPEIGAEARKRIAEKYTFRANSEKYTAFIS